MRDFRDWKRRRTMFKHHRFVFGALVGAIGLVLCLTKPVLSQRPPAEETLNQRLAKASKLKEEEVTRLLNALGPAIQEDLRAGKQVTLPGLGTFRVVRIGEHRDLQDGRPVTVPAINTVEFIPVGTVVDSANSSNAQPAETVPSFQYNTLPGQTPGQKTGRTRVPPTRTR
jgi:nucleoid DNA-binding protein